MNNVPLEYGELLEEAITKAKAMAPRAVDDLLRFSSQAAVAVTKVTGGAAVLELAPTSHGGNGTPTYQLVLRKVGSEAPPSDLGVYRVTAAGYPVLRWYSRRGFESHPETEDQAYVNASELEGNFRWMVSNPESRLVILVTFFQQKAASATQSSDVSPA